MLWLCMDSLLRVKFNSTFSLSPFDKIHAHQLHLAAERQLEFLWRGLQLHISGRFRSCQLGVRPRTDGHDCQCGQHE
jgi:hypothetical protein